LIIGGVVTVDVMGDGSGAIAVDVAVVEGVRVFPTWWPPLLWFLFCSFISLMCGYLWLFWFLFI